MKPSNTLTTSDFAAATNLPIVLDSTFCLRSHSAWSSSKILAHVSTDLAIKRSESPRHRRNDPLADIAANLPNQISKIPVRMSPTIDCSSLLFNQSSTLAALDSNQRTTGESSERKNLHTSWLTSSLSPLIWLPMAFVNLPTVEAKEEDLQHKTKSPLASDHLATQSIDPHIDTTESCSNREENAELSDLHTLPNISLLNLEKNSTPPRCPSRLKESPPNTVLNRSVRFSDPTPLGIQTDQSQWLHNFSIDTTYDKVDAFPSPTPGKRFLGRGSIDSNYQSPRKASLPDWVVNEYLSSNNSPKKLEPIGDLKSLQTHPTHKNQSNPGTQHPRMNFTLNTYKRSRPSTTSHSILPARHLPPPGKVFYPLLHHSEVKKFNQNNDSLSLSPHLSPRLQNVNQKSASKLSFKSKIRQIFVFRKKSSKKSNVSLPNSLN
ncbi:hypothetical protein PTTG_28781 [Puccinia triticina 1-1 BBBD Race 1]|uniref:Uncharacterized protein n=2 Tax=Puccinia triticina TaxID=208348 RepID=A0A180G970_PUCT1|nr:uncharacterized protein PtA15_13A398 [Puccinia triticina]OAV89160.1 hypothetical protein PTTG_28781 [Puccinia triticina 1-1 BBBD Race 1]WAQ90998.1 hypothetical protein PtA15_13A398 [Puccinia triticina]WAR61188.1 hypothetical protein PtB15_13B440 [Puccinia triticina]